MTNEAADSDAASVAETPATPAVPPAPPRPPVPVAQPTRMGWTCCCAMLPAPGSFVAVTRSTNGRIAVARMCNVRDSSQGIVFDVIGSYDTITPDPSWLWYELPELPRVSGAMA